MQELSTAMQILASDQTVEAEGARRWAQGVLLRFHEVDLSNSAGTAIGALKKDREISESLCIFPPDRFPPPRNTQFDPITEESIKAIEGMSTRDAKLGLARLLVDYSRLKSDLDLTVSYLRHTCGFSLRDENTEPAPSTIR